MFSHPCPKFLSAIRCFVSTCPPPPAKPIVTLLDALSGVGSNLALLLKQNVLIKELRVFDEEKSTKELAEDIGSIDTKTKIKGFETKEFKRAIMGSHIVISTGGCQCKMEESQKDLFEKNVDNVRNVALYLSEFNPGAIFCIAKPPVEGLVPMACEEYKRAGTYDPKKIIGVITPTSMIINTIIAVNLNRDPTQIHCPVIGGLSPDTTVPIVSQIRPNVQYNSKLYEDLQESAASAEKRTIKKGATLCYSKAAAIARFMNLLLRSFTGRESCAECAFVPQTGHISEFLPYMSSIVKLGREGVISSHMPKMNDLETSRLKAAAPFILEDVLLGESVQNGGFEQRKSKSRKTCDGMLKSKLQKSCIRTCK